MAEQRRMKETSAAACSRIGRRGDPRMHRAVAARIAYPSLTLFQALQIGGFEYSNDEDPNQLDSEQIALIQRKNQLSRRIRFALRQQNTTDGKMETFSEHKRDQRSKDKNTAPKPMVHASPSAASESIPNGEPSEFDVQQSPSKKARSTLNVDMSELESIIEEEIQKSMEAGSSEFQSTDDEEHDNDWRSIVSEQEGFIDFLLSKASPVETFDIKAVSSLHQTAASLGMNLKKLASLLSRNTKNLATMLHVHEPQENMVTANHNEATLVHQHLQAALSAWQQEGKRLRQLIAQCKEHGRTPILHQPVENGQPHIDFIVDHCVECYSGFVPQKGHATHGMNNGDNNQSEFFSNNTDPIIYDQKDIDWESDEWETNLLRSDSLMNFLA